MKGIAWAMMGVVLSLVTGAVDAAMAASGAQDGPAVTMATEPEVEQSARSRQASGTIVSVDRQAKTVTVKSRTGEQTFVLSPRVRVKLGNLKATLADVQPGKKVFIRYRDVDGAATATTIKVL